MKKNLKIGIVAVLLILVGVLCYFAFFSKKEISIINFSQDKLEIEVENSLALTIYKENIDDNFLSFYSSDENIISITKDGIITAKKKGEAVVSLKYQKEDILLTDTIEISVFDNYEIDNLNINYEFTKGIENKWNNEPVTIKAWIDNQNTHADIVSFVYSLNCALEETCEKHKVLDEIVIDEEGDNYLFFTVTDSYDNTKNSKVNVLIDKTKPLIKIDLKEDTYHQIQNINIDVSDESSGILDYNVEVYKDDVKAITKNDYASRYTVNMNSDGKWKIVVKVSDNAGNTSELTANYVINVLGYYEGPGGDGYEKTVSIQGRTYKFYKQYLYKDVTFWHGTMDKTGCGPTSLAIALSGFMEITPKETAKLMGYGTFSRMEHVLSSKGFKYEKVLYNSNDSNKEKMKNIENKVLNHLKKGYPVIVLLTIGSKSKCEKNKVECPNRWRYTGGNGHFITLVGVREDGKLIMSNPSGKGYDDTLYILMNYFMVGGGRGFLLINT